ncbi:MAG: long-chain fatty acid--CoA ligase [Candidatus Cloacimonetes bacterium]|nr:long-chain fatty acid--CoA ligase [Candidatus Cloacimonadota bacterium]
MKDLERFTLKALIDRTCKAYGKRPALSWVDDEPITYNELRERIDEVVGLMRENGIEKGDKVAILSQNMPQWGVAYLAITSMGAVVVPILVDFHINEILHIIRHSGSKMVFVSSLQYEKIGYSDLDPMPQLVLLDSFEPIQDPLSQDKVKSLIQMGKKQFSILRGKALKAVGLIDSDPQENDLAAIVYTSGTTGNTKGVMLSHKNLVYDAHITMGIQKVDENDRLLSVLPLPHTYECTIGFIIPMMQGSCVYYLDKPPTARVLIPAMQKIRPTMMLTVPLIIEKIFKIQIYPQLNSNMLMRKMYKIPPLRKMLHKVAGKKLMKTFGGALHFFGIGGALLSEEVERFLYEANFPYAIGYGLTETSPLIAGCTPAVVKFRSTGVILDTLQVRIDSPHPKTGIGEIQVKGDTVMMGYYKDKVRTEEAFTEDGFFRTGDLGRMKRGYLYIKGRSKNVIVAATGENIYPEDLEARLNDDEGVLESLVYQSNGKIIGRVFLNAEILDAQYHLNKMGTKQAERFISKYLENLRGHINHNVASFARINNLIQQIEPFEKTPTQKIKRFLYQ